MMNAMMWLPAEIVLRPAGLAGYRFWAGRNLATAGWTGRLSVSGRPKIICGPKLQLWSAWYIADPGVGIDTGNGLPLGLASGTSRIAWATDETVAKGIG
jgi:hypothetical protein